MQQLSWRPQWKVMLKAGGALLAALLITTLLWWSNRWLADNGHGNLTLLRAINFYLLIVTAATTVLCAGLFPFVAVWTLLTSERPPIGEWRDIVSCFRGVSTLSANGKSVQDIQAVVERLDDRRLLVASIFPSHTETAKAAAKSECQKRSLDLKRAYPEIPTFIPLRKIAEFEKQIKSTQFIRHAALYLFIIGALTPYTITVSNLDVKGFHEIIIIIVLLTLAVSLAIMYFGKYLINPARILILRKFNRNNLKFAYKFLINEFMDFGHVITLSDRVINRSILKEFAEKYLWIFFEDVYLAAFKLVGFILFSPFLFGLRLYDPTRFGPPNIMSARDYRHFAHRLHDRDSWTLRSGKALVRTSDLWWQAVIEMLMRSADLIVLDVSEVTEGTAWEITKIAELDLWHRVLFVGQFSEKTEAYYQSILDEYTSSLLSCRLHFYSEGGWKAGRSDVRVNILNTIKASLTGKESALHFG